LNDAGGRRFIAIAGGMGNSQAHDSLISESDVSGEGWL
jgi:hypothetical protein